MFTVAILSVTIAGIATWFSRAAAAAAKDQVETQQQIAREYAQPYVWADIRPNAKYGGQLVLVVGNSGRTIAENIRLKIDREPPTTGDHRVLLEPALRRFEAGHASMPPGRTNEWILGVSHEILDDPDSDLRFRFTISAAGPYGTIPTLSYDVDLNDWRAIGDQPNGSLHTVRESIDRLTSETAKVRGAVSTWAEVRD